MSDDRTEPHCPDAGNGTPGLGCPECLRFEVRSHVVECPTHGEHMELACCWCGLAFFSFVELKHEGVGHPVGNA